MHRRSDLAYEQTNHASEELIDSYSSATLVPIFKTVDAISRASMVAENLSPTQLAEKQLGNKIYGILVNNKVNHSYTYFKNLFSKHNNIKELVLAYIKTIPDLTTKKLALETAMDNTTLLGKLFWWRRGFLPTRISAGTLKQIADELRKIQLQEMLEIKPVKLNFSSKFIYETMAIPLHTNPVMELNQLDQLLEKSPESNGRLEPIYKKLENLPPPRSVYLSALESNKFNQEKNEEKTLLNKLLNDLMKINVPSDESVLEQDNRKTRLMPIMG